MFAVISPGLHLPVPTEIPHPLSPQTDNLATLALLILGFLLVAAAISAAGKRE